MWIDIYICLQLILEMHSNERIKIKSWASEGHASLVRAYLSIFVRCDTLPFNPIIAPTCSHNNNLPLLITGNSFHNYSHPRKDARCEAFACNANFSSLFKSISFSIKSKSTPIALSCFFSAVNSSAFLKTDPTKLTW